MFYVYLLYSHKDRRFYTGFTHNIEERYLRHAHGEVVSTKNRRPLTLIYYEAYKNEKDAKGREIFLKSGAGKRFLKNQLTNTLKDITVG